MSYNSPFASDVIIPTDVSYRLLTISSNTTLNWAGYGDNPTARIMEVIATTTGLTLTMPPADQASVGSDALIRNLGTNSFVVKNSLGATIASIDAGKAEYIYITDTSGTWGVIGFGTGTSFADASTLAGAGLQANGAKLDQIHEVSSLPAAYTVQTSDLAKALVWQSGAGNITLPTAQTLGANWFTLIKNNGTGTLQVTCTGIQTIDGTVSKNFAPNESAFIVCTGTSYFTVGYGVSNQFKFSALVKPVTSGSYTLNANEAASTIQEFVGSLSGNVVITYPPVVNLYVVSNQTTANGHTLTITTGSGSTALVPSGQQATLVCDGTNFFNANTVQAGATFITLLDGTVGSPSMTFINESSTGLYRVGYGQIGISVLGMLRASFNTTGLTVNGTGTFTSGIQGGAF